jgi:hypothetical protein
MPWIHAKKSCFDKGMKLVSLETSAEDIAIIQAIYNREFFFQSPKDFTPTDVQKNFLQFDRFFRR